MPRKTAPAVNCYHINSIAEGGSLSSVKVIRTSKSINFEVKCYSENAKKAQSDAEQIFEELNLKYPVTE